MVGSESEEGSLDELHIRRDTRRNTLYQTLDGVEDRDGIIHRAVWIDGDGETLFTKALSDAVSKTRTYEEHLLAWPDPEPRLWYIYNRPELHKL